jgi:hypothetical protein
MAQGIDAMAERGAATELFIGLTVLSAKRFFNDNAGCWAGRIY